MAAEDEEELGVFLYSVVSSGTKQACIFRVSRNCVDFSAQASQDLSYILHCIVHDGRTSNNNGLTCESLDMYCYPEAVCICLRVDANRPACRPCRC